MWSKVKFDADSHTYTVDGQVYRRAIPHLDGNKRLCIKGCKTPKGRSAVSIFGVPITVF